MQIHRGGNLQSSLDSYLQDASFLLATSGSWLSSSSSRSNSSSNSSSSSGGWVRCRGGEQALAVGAVPPAAAGRSPNVLDRFVTIRMSGLQSDSGASSRPSLLQKMQSAELDSVQSRLPLRLFSIAMFQQMNGPSTDSPLMRDAMPLVRLLSRGASDRSVTTPAGDTAAVGMLHEGSWQLMLLHKDGLVQFASQLFDAVQRHFNGHNYEQLMQPISAELVHMTDARFLNALHGPRSMLVLRAKADVDAEESARAAQFPVIPWCSNYVMHLLQQIVLSLNPACFTTVSQQSAQLLEHAYGVGTDEEGSHHADAGAAAAMEVERSDKTRTKARTCSSGGTPVTKAINYTPSDVALLEQTIRGIGLSAQAAAISQLLQVVLRHQDLLPRMPIHKSLTQYRGSILLPLSENDQRSKMRRRLDQQQLQVGGGNNGSSSTVVGPLPSEGGKVRLYSIQNILESDWRARDALAKTMHALDSWDHSIRAGNHTAAAPEGSILSAATMNRYK